MSRRLSGDEADFVALQGNLKTLAATTRLDLAFDPPWSLRKYLETVDGATLGIIKEDQMTLATSNEVVREYTERVRKAYASMLDDDAARDPSSSAASRFKPVASINTTGSALPLLAHSHLRPAQDHIMDVVEAYCKRKPDWVNIPVSIPSIPSPTIRQQQSRIRTLARTLLDLRERSLSGPDGDTALLLLSAVQRHNNTVARFFNETRDRK